MTDWVEWGSFGAAAAAVAVAFYAVWAGFRNQIKVTDRESRRGNYAQYLVALSDTYDLTVELDGLFTRYWKVAGPLLASKDGRPPIGELKPEDAPSLVFHIQQWVNSALSGTPIETGPLLEELRKYGMPNEMPIILEGLKNALSRLAITGEKAHLAGKILKLSGTPSAIRNGANRLVGDMTQELLKCISPNGPPREWEKIEKRIARLEDQMVSDMATSR